MNPLIILVNRSLKQQGVSKSDLARRAGYRNINKGLRKLDAFLKDPVDDDQYVDVLTRLDGVSTATIQRAIGETRQLIDDKDRWVFKPYLQVTLDRRPSPIFVAAMQPHLTTIRVPESLIEQPFAEEISTVCALYQAHRIKYSPGWPAGNGFCYHRRYKEALSFDADGRRVDDDECQAYAFEMRLK